MQQFIRYCPEVLPLGGSLDALTEGTAEEENLQYTYAWDPGAVGVGMNTVMNIIIVQNHCFNVSLFCMLAELQGLLLTFSSALD